MTESVSICQWFHGNSCNWAHSVHHVPNFMSYQGANGGLVITGRTLSIYVNVYIWYSPLTDSLK